MSERASLLTQFLRERCGLEYTVKGQPCQANDTPTLPPAHSQSVCQRLRHVAQGGGEKKQETKVTVVADLRSDTLTQPSEGMRAAMARAVCGDDVWNEDPTVQRLEKEVAHLLGKESGLFVPSGTMGNLLAMMVHCRERLSEIIAGDKCHIVGWEVGGSGLVGAQIIQVATNEDGTLPLEAVEGAIRGVDVHNPTTRLLLLENTHMLCGGKALPVAYLQSARALCDKHKVAMHCDGARLWNAAVALGVPLETLARPFDSVTVCFSKGMGTPVGSVLVGTTAFIGWARRVRKQLGGGMRQVGILAAAGLYALENNFHRMAEDHKHAQELALALAPYCDVIVPQSNILFFFIYDTAKRRDFISRCERERVRVAAVGKVPGMVRAVLHCDVTQSAVQHAATVMTEACRDLKLCPSASQQHPNPNPQKKTSHTVTTSRRSSLGCIVGMIILSVSS